MSLDTAFYYHLTNSFLGADRALEVKPDGSGRLRMGSKEDRSEQSWRLVGLGGDRYALRTEYLGDGFSLDVFSHGRRETPWLAPSGGYSGQSWALEPWGDGTYKLTNDFTGPDQLLDTTGDTQTPILSPGDFTGQHWTLTPGRKIESNNAIPDLDPKGNADPTEGPTDFDLYARPIGVVRAVMIFVDFRDAQANTSPADVARHILGNGNAHRMLYDQSGQKLTLDVTVEARLGWRRMKKKVRTYNTHTFDQHRAYIEEAANLFSGDIKFSDYSLVFIVASEHSDLGGASSFTAPADSAAASKSGEIRLAVTFDQDSHHERYTTLVHEVGHLFGLPDLYPAGGGAHNSKAGCWPIMSDIFHASGFLGWHRNKNGWLDAERRTYIDKDVTSWSATLHPLSGMHGLSMIVLPMDDSKNPSKVYVIELAQQVLGTNGEYWGEGVLVYTVDATISTRSSPVVIIPKRTSYSPEYGNLFEAPFIVGDSGSDAQQGASLSWKVVERFGSSYVVTIDYKSP